LAFFIRRYHGDQIKGDEIAVICRRRGEICVHNFNRKTWRGDATCETWA